MALQKQCLIRLAQKERALVQTRKQRSWVVRYHNNERLQRGQEQHNLYLQGVQNSICAQNGPNCQKHLGLPFWTLLEPFEPLWNVDKPAMFGHFCLFYWCVFLGHPVCLTKLLSDRLRIKLSNLLAATGTFHIQPRLGHLLIFQCWNLISSSNTDTLWYLILSSYLCPVVKPYCLMIWDLCCWAFHFKILVLRMSKND